MIRDYFRHLITSFLIVCFFNTSSVSAAIDFDSPCYSSENPYYLNEYGGQCTAFAWGRTCEKTGIKLVFKNEIDPPYNPPYPHAKYWYEEGPIDSLNLQLGSDIRPNSIAIWEENKEVSYGHVAYVERVEDGIVYFNEANWDTYCGATCNWWGGGYDGYEESSPVDDFEHRDAKDGIRYDILGYLYLTPPLPQDLSLVRIEGTDPVYWLQNGRAYHVLSMDIINSMSELPGWNHICDYSPDALEIISLGPIQPGITFLQGPDFITTGPESDGLLIKLPDDPKVYLMENGERRWITTGNVFDELGYDWDDIITVTPAILALIPKGNPIYSPQPDFYLLSGTLTDASANPLQGWIYANETSGANLGNNVYSSDGTYEMALFPGNYNVYAYVYTYYSQGYSRIKTQTQNITIDQDSTLDIKEPTYSLYHLTGKVMDTNGVGIASVAIRANHNSGDCYANVTTNSDGTYDLLLIDGTYSLYFTPPADSTFLEEKIYDFQITGNDTHNVFLNSSEHTLSGTLIDTNQNPASGWWVYAYEVNGPDYRNIWSSDGTCQMFLLPSIYKVYAYAYTFYYSPNYSYTRILTPYQTVNISGNTFCNIEVPLHDSYHLTGKVTDTSDVAQPNVQITAYDSSHTYYAYTTTGSGGNYDILLPPGTYRLIIKAPPATYPPFEIQNLQISGDSVRNIRLSLEYTILDEAIAQLLANLELSLDVFDIIDQEETLSYDIIVQGIKDLMQIILNWQGSEMKITLYDPDGNIYGEYQSTNPPINIEIPNPAEGTWTCEVTAVDVPHDNYPFALVVGISPNQAPVADANGPYSGSVDDLITFDASGSYDPDGEIATYEWDWDGDGTYDQSSNSASITHTWTESYSGTIYLRVKDSEGATDIDNTSVAVTAGQPPLADAGPDQTVAVGADCLASISLDGSGSSDPDGDSLTYTWTWSGGSAEDVKPTVQLPLGTTTITLVVNDGTEDSEPDEVEITVEDTTPPATQITSPVSNQALQDGVILTADASDACGVADVYFYVREADGGTGSPIEYEGLQGAYNGSSWECDFETNTSQTPDGYYVILTKAVDANGNEAWSDPAPVSIRNWAVVELLPNTANNKAGRTMPVKFALRIAEAVDSTQPFVHNQELEIRVCDASGAILQASLYGDTSTDYRIDNVKELYITNFRTSKTPAEYVVEIWRINKNFLIGNFAFETVK